MIRGNDVMFKGKCSEEHLSRHRAKMAVHPWDAGIDLLPCEVHQQELISSYQCQVWVKTGLHLTFPERTYGMLTVRSSSDSRLAGGTVINGTIDSGYTGELMVRIRALTAEVHDVVRVLALLIHDRVAIAQIIPMVIFVPHFVQWDDKAAAMLSARADRGFGHTDSLHRPSSSIVLAPEESGWWAVELTCNICKRHSVTGELRYSAICPMHGHLVDGQ